MYRDLANCIRFLTVDAIAKANSGHPGMPLGMADIMTVLFKDVLCFDANQPNWINRDRLVLSNGHGSMLLYAALYLSGYDITLEDIKSFRKLGSVCDGHPEYNIAKGIEVTTGPLGQGLGNAVGMAVAKERLRTLCEQVDYHTFCFVGDGCLMEGISHEVCSLAPKLIQKGLTIIWDDNGISIDGQIDPWFEQDVLKRFESYGFEVIRDVDGHDHEAIKQALCWAKASEKLCFIQMKTIIGKGCRAHEGSALVHGQPISQSLIQVMREDENWPYPPFEIPPELKRIWESFSTVANTHWQPPSLEMNQEALFSWLEQEPEQNIATRKASAKVLQMLAKKMPTLMGGSADLTASNLTGIPDSGLMNRQEKNSQYIAYGVREFGMFAIANGLALSHLVPFVGTFLTFMDYGRNALRMAALMKLRVIYVLTHDSIGLGEDGPTHQPVEHLLMCRATPNVYVWRPCNLAETLAAWSFALTHQGPTVLALSRQAFGVVPRAAMDVIQKGAYYLHFDDDAEAAIIATGSEVALALAVYTQLAQVGIPINIISAPCLALVRQSKITEKYQRERLFAIEAASPLSFLEWVPRENIFGVEQFGLSGAAESLYEHFGLTPVRIAKIVQSRIKGEKGS